MELTEKPQSGHEYAETLLSAAKKEQRGKLTVFLHLLSDKFYSSVIIVIILTTIIAPFMLKSAIMRQAKAEAK